MSRSWHLMRCGESSQQLGRCALDFVLEHSAHFVDKESPGPSMAVNWPLSAGLGICGTQISQPLYLWNVELRS